MLYGKYSLFSMLKEARDNKHIIEAYIKKQPIEGLDDDDDYNQDTMFFGLGVGLGLFLLAVSLAIWIWALTVTIKYWKMLPVWARILAVIGLVSGFGGPIMTLIVVYAAKDQGPISYDRRRYPMNPSSMNPSSMNLSSSYNNQVYNRY